MKKQIILAPLLLCKLVRFMFVKANATSKEIISNNLYYEISHSELWLKNTLVNFKAWVLLKLPIGAEMFLGLSDPS